ncbi:MAG: TonB-dependent receptor plug domain-containing protein [Candidatus Omnitrophota bacterium]|nr:TonB-dependent receptor plug domain-containing protein [Candidatus Omnitrophota bacterium]
MTGGCIIVGLCVAFSGAPVCRADGGHVSTQETRSSNAYRLQEVTVTAEELKGEGPFLPEVKGTGIYAGKKTAIIHLQERPAILNNNFRQVLATTPGLLLSEETTPLLSIGYRGLEPHRTQFTQVLKDGIPIHAEMFGYPESYYTPPLQSIDHVEFLHGGASLMYGPQPGGALNFITKQPTTDTPFAAYTENSFGTDELFSHYTSLSGHVDPLGYLGYFHEREGNGFRESNSDFEVLGGGLKMTFGQTTDSRWTLGYDEYHEEHGEPGGLTKAVADSEGRDQTTRLHDRFRLERYYGTLIYEREIGEASQFDFRTFGGHYRRYSKRQRGGGFGTLPSGANASTNSIEEQDFYTFGFEPRIRHTYDAFGQDGQTLTAGVLTYFSDAPREDQRGASPDADSGSLRNKSDREMQYLSLFAEHLFRFGPLSVTPGVRLEHIWQHVKEHVNADKAGAGTPLADADEFDVVPLFGIGAAYDVAPRAQFYSNLSQGYRPKIFTQAVPTGATNVINNDLEEGKSWIFDVGARGRPWNALSWDLSYFLMKFSDQIGTSGNTIENVGDATHQGLEFATEVDLVSLYDATQGTTSHDQVGSISPFFSLMLLDARFTEGPQDGKTPQYAPQYTMRFGVHYRLKDRVKLGLGSTFVDDHFADDSNLANRTVPSYKVWDLTGEVALWRDYLTLVGGINNLFDERYYARVRSDGIDPAPERNVYGGVRIGVRF